MVHQVIVCMSMRGGQKGSATTNFVTDVPKSLSVAKIKRFAIAFRGVLPAYLTLRLPT